MTFLFQKIMTVPHAAYYPFSQVSLNRSESLSFPHPSPDPSTHSRNPPQRCAPRAHHIPKVLRRCSTPGGLLTNETARRLQVPAPNVKAISMSLSATFVESLGASVFEPPPCFRAISHLLNERRATTTSRNKALVWGALRIHSFLAYT